MFFVFFLCVGVANEKLTFNRPICCVTKVFGMCELISGMKRMLEELLESLESPGKKYFLQLRQEIELAWFICNRAHIVCSSQVYEFDCLSLHSYGIQIMEKQRP